MKIKKLNEWKCDMNIDDASVYVEPTGALKDMIEHFNLKYNLRTESYDCDGDVELYDYYYCLNATKQSEFDKAFVKDGRMTIRFGEVKGNFILPGDKDTPYILTSLEGCPESVGGWFSCSHNQLTSLDGCPEDVGGGFDCGNNQLTSLEGCQKTVGGDFDCSNNKLTSLDGCPETVGGDFSCNYNQLTSLDGCPKTVGGYFDCGCNQLTALEGCPKSVGGWFDCSNNQLTSLEGCPKSVDCDFWCSDNEIEFTKNDVCSVCNVNGSIYV